MMPDRSAKSSDSGPLNPQGADGRVTIVDPPQAEIGMSAEEADLSGIRLLDAADQARKDRDPGRSD